MRCPGALCYPQVLGPDKPVPLQQHSPLPKGREGQQLWAPHPWEQCWEWDRGPRRSSQEGVGR